MKKYGFPYMGSKRKLAEKIVSILPPAENFYDLFAGGCAITHCAMEQGDIFGNKWKNFIANDIQGTTKLFAGAIAGKYKNESRWISREDFKRLKDSDPYVRWIWSFGNSGSDYMFGKDIEELKKLAHFYLFENGYDGTPKKRTELVKRFKEEMKKDGRFELQRLEQLERLQQLEQDYRTVPIKENSIIYCDPPYKDTCGYSIDFDHDEFWNWVREQNVPVFVSEYQAPEDMKIVLSIERTSLLSSKSRVKKIENVYWNGL